MQPRMPRMVRRFGILFLLKWLPGSNPDSRKPRRREELGKAVEEADVWVPEVEPAELDKGDLAGLADGPEHKLPRQPSRSRIPRGT